MPGHEIPEIVCPQCSAVLGAGEGRCPRCGAAETAGPLSARRKRRRDMAESRGMVLLLLFAVLGPLALPVLWRSTRFSRAWKIALTVLVVIATGVVVWLLWFVVHLFVESLREYGIIERS